VVQAEKDDAEVATGVAKDFGQETEEAAEMQKQLAASKRMRTTFRGLKVFVNREVPLRPAYFTLLCGGAAEVGWERGASGGGKAAPGSAFAVDHEKITHQVVDRPTEQLEIRAGREYVQPQWVFDSFNVGCLLPVAPYAPGRSLPPHLSPFVDDKAEGYVPRQREILNKLAAEAGAGAAQSAAEGAGADSTAAAAQEEGAFDRYRQELRAEAKGVWHSAYQGEGAEAAPEARPEATPATETALTEGPQEAELVPAPKPTDAEEERLRAKALMPKKHKRLLQRIEKGEKKKTDGHALLLKKRRQLEASGAPA